MAFGEASKKCAGRIRYDPDARLRTVAEILETRRVANRPDSGLIRWKTTVYNQGVQKT